MLRQRALIQVLGQVNTGDVTGAFLFNRDAYSGVDAGGSSMSAALIASVWDAFDKKEKQEDKPLKGNTINEKLHEMIIECESATVACTRVSSMLLALSATPKVPLGMLRAKLLALAKYLGPSMETVSKHAEAEKKQKEQAKADRGGF